MEVLASLDGELHVKLHIRNKVENFIWSLIAVYGATQEEFKADFLQELVNLVKDNPYPIIIWGSSTCLDFHSRRARVGLMIIDLSYSMQSLTAWI
jgi:hypothetical protein